ncbi:hypothetical protein M747DRAFT_31779 [Aspergillus niger ATCC 13496]|nr:hypothetical protein M747DRAFT_31779 [Aspergillus niger ATCC 13496]
MVNFWWQRDVIFSLAASPHSAFLRWKRQTGWIPLDASLSDYRAANKETWVRVYLSHPARHWVPVFLLLSGGRSRIRRTPRVPNVSSRLQFVFCLRHTERNSVFKLLEVEHSRRSTTNKVGHIDIANKHISEVKLLEFISVVPCQSVSPNKVDYLANVFGCPSTR